MGIACGYSCCRRRYYHWKQYYWTSNHSKFHSTNPNASTTKVNSANANTNISNNNIVSLSITRLQRRCGRHFLQQGCKQNSWQFHAGECLKPATFSLIYSITTGISLNPTLDDIINSNTIHHLSNTYNGYPQTIVMVY